MSVPSPSAPSGPTPPDRNDPAGRPVRRDARANREKLLTAAREAFAAAEGPVSLEGIARQAGVGIGTLYRHFPTREDLVDAVYAAEVDAVAEIVPALLDQHPADLALRAWIGRYAEFVATKRGMMDTLRAGFASGRLKAPSQQRLTATIATILEHDAAGTLRSDLDADDVTWMLVGVFAAILDGASRDRTERLLDLLLDAMRSRGGQPRA